METTKDTNEKTNHLLYLQNNYGWLLSLPKLNGILISYQKESQQKLTENHSYLWKTD